MRTVFNQNVTPQDEVFGYLLALFQGLNEQSQELQDLWKAEFRRHNPEDLREAVARHRKESRFNTCQISDITTKLQQVVLEKTTQRTRTVESVPDVYRRLGKVDGTDAQVIVRWHRRVNHARGAKCGEEYRQRWMAADVKNCYTDLIRMELDKAENHDNYENVSDWANKLSRMVAMDPREFSQVIEGI
jgi:hypothetical protein